MSRVVDFYNYIDKIAPFSTQESWDNSGFLVGDGDKEVKKVMLALDATEDVLREAERKGADLVITHHQVILGSLKEFHPSNLAFVAAQKGIAIISAHTCLDVAEGGVNDCLASALELSDVGKCGDELGLLRIGNLKNEMNCLDFIKYVSEKLGVGGIKYTPTDKMIKKVAVCGGSGAEFFTDAMRSGADAYVTANIKHNFFIEIKRAGFCVLDAGHFCTENTVIKPLAEKIKGQFADTEVLVSEDSCDPALYWSK